MIKGAFLLMLLAVPHIDNCSPTKEQCAAAMLPIHEKELECGRVAPTLDEKKTNSVCQTAIEWRAAYDEKCGGAANK